MVVMALDHANALVARGKLEPEMWTTLFPDYMGGWLAFVTRWVTHLAAPGFFFLMGVGAVLFARSRAADGWNRPRITGQLAIRGTLLILLQFLLENPAWAFGDAGPQNRYIGVLFALGGSLIAASLLLSAGRWWLVAGGTLLLVATELVLPQATNGWVEYQPFQLLLLWPGLGESMFSLYPILPWLGVTMLGMGFGRWLAQDQDRAQSAMLPLGLSALGGFVVLRLIDGFGNIVPTQTDDLIGFLNVVKYPPSITFVLMTLGLGFVITWGFWKLQQRRPGSLRILIIYGVVPLFFYIVHLWLYAVMGQVIDPSGTGLGPAFYALWLLGLALLYPACRWYGRFKRSRPIGSLWRFV